MARRKKSDAPQPKGPPVRFGDRFECKVNPEDKAAWQRAADLVEMNLADWVRATLNRAAKVVLGE